MDLIKKERYLEWGIFFWLGVGVISLINIWKIDYNQNALSYSWIMLGVSIVFIIVAAAMYLIRIKGKK